MNSTAVITSPTLPSTTDLPSSTVPISSNNQPSSSAPPPTSASNPPSQTSNAGPTSAQSQTTAIFTSVVTQAATNSQGQTTVVVISTTEGSTITQIVAPTTASSSAVTTSSGGPVNTTDTGASKSSGPSASVVAPAVVVPIVAVALLVVAGIFFWRKRKSRMQAEEARKKEMEEYSYNPNNDPSIPAVGTAVSGEESNPAGYRGWGTTSSATRKASTTLSSGMARSDDGGNAYFGQYSPNGPNSENHSDAPLMDQNANAEPVGALGAAPVAGNRGTGVNRGPSNASSAYSAGANRSDTSGEGPSPMHVGSPQYYNDLMHQDNGMPHDHVDGTWGGQPVIKDVSARRNTRIENPSVFPQQGNSGISQNF